MDRLHTEVLIVGGGPVGLSAALLLARHGVDSVLVERRSTSTEHPKATVINARSSELMRQLGIEEEIRERGLPLERSGFVSWFTRLHGQLLGSLPLVEADPAEFMRRLAQSPTLPLICPQNELEAVLVERLEQLDRVDVRFGCRLEGFEQGEGAVIARCESGEDTFEVKAAYMIAADGARSAVRDRLGIDERELSELGTAVNIHFEADLGPVVDEVPSVLYWIVNPELQGVIHTLDGERRWLLNLSTGEGVAYDSVEACEELVRTAVGEPALELRTLSVRPWTMRAAVAERFREGRVFLAGDAAHQMPPTGGFGMNTGIQDVHNLAWKLAAVLRGRAGEGLLATYEDERLPVARSNTDRSVANALRMIESGLFFDPGDGSLDAIEGEGEESERLRARIAAAIPEQREHFAFDGQDLGFAYEGGAVLPDGSEGPQPDNPVLEYLPSAHPGARAPHVWLEVDGEEVSTLDLFDLRPVLLVAGADPGWREALDRIDPERELVELRAVDGEDLADPAGELQSLYGLAPGGAVLVRPDGHVAARYASFPEDAGVELARAAGALGIALAAGQEQRA